MVIREHSLSPDRLGTARTCTYVRTYSEWPDVELDGLDMPIMVGLCAGAGMAGIGVGEVRGFPRFS